jgi:hypothetical protein
MPIARLRLPYKAAPLEAHFQVEPGNEIYTEPYCYLVPSLRLGMPIARLRLPYKAAEPLELHFQVERGNEIYTKPRK